MGRLRLGFLLAERLLEGATELQNTHDTNTLVTSVHVTPDDIMSAQMRKILCAVSKQWPLSGLGKEAKSRAVRVDENDRMDGEEGAGFFFSYYPKN